MTESWLKEQDLQFDLEIDGFGEPFWLGRDSSVTGKTLGLMRVSLQSGVTWWSSGKHCEWLREWLSVSLCLFYLPREFPQLFITLVCVNHKANVDLGHSCHCENSAAPPGDHPRGAPNFIIDFYHYKPAVAGKLLPICYTSNGTHKISQSLLWVQKCAYKSHNRAPLGASDHNVVNLVASYKSVLSQYWFRHGQESSVSSGLWQLHRFGLVQRCFAITWTNLLTLTVTAHISSCEDLVVSKKLISVYPITTVKGTVKQWNISFSKWDMTR